MESVCVYTRYTISLGDVSDSTIITTKMMFIHLSEKNIFLKLNDCKLIGGMIYCILGYKT